MTLDPLLTTKAVAVLLGCSPRMVRKLVEQRQLRARRLGSELRFELADVVTFRLKQHRQTYSLPVDWCFWQAVEAHLRAERRAKREARKSRKAGGP